MLGISIAVFVLLMLLTFGIWVLLNIGGAIFLSLLGEQEISAMPMAEFLSNFVGSPMFYICMADLAVMAVAVTGLAVTRKR